MIILDTGPIVAAINAKDDRHVECADLLEYAEGELIVPAPVFTEVCYLLEKRAGTRAEAAFLWELTSGNLRLEPLQHADLERTHELVVQYADLPLGAVDASVIAVAERLGATQVATIDHRHFRVVRSRVDFTLLP